MIEQLKKMSWFLSRRWKDYSIAVLSLMAVNAVVIFPPWLIGKAVDSITDGSLTPDSLYSYIGILICLMAADYVLSFVWAFKLFENSILLERQLLSKMMEKLLNMKAPFFEKFNTGDLMARATSDVKEITELAGFGVLTFFDGTTFTAAIVLMMGFGISWRLTLVSILPLPLLALLIIKTGNYLHNFFMESQMAFSRLNNQTLEYVSGVRVIRAYTMEERVQERFKELGEEVYQKSLRASVISGLFPPVTRTFTTVSFALAVGYGAILISKKIITVGELISFNVYLNYLIWPMFAIGEMVNVAQRAHASLKRVHEVLEEENQEEELENTRLQEEIDTIKWTEYSFSYPSSLGNILNKINLEIKRGQTIGIVGKTGSGKTTLVKQLLKEYSQGEGILLINGKDLRELNKVDWMEQIGYVAQDNVLFSKSIRENILFGNKNATERELHDAMVAADIEKDLMALPQGIETLVGERGIAVSGGQKQRISIARGLIKKPELLILDDSLSAVDAKTERKIIGNIRQNRKDKTNLIVTHRLSAVEHADWIIVLEEGRIAEEGTHQQLMEQDKWYAQQHALQGLEEAHGQD